MIVQLYHKVREKHPSGLGLFAYLYAFTIHILLILLRLNPRNLFAFLYKAYFLSRPSRYFEMIFLIFISRLIQVQVAAKLFKHSRQFISKNSYPLQFYEISICQVMLFGLFIVCTHRHALFFKSKKIANTSVHYYRC